MSTEVAIHDMSREKVELIKQTVAKGSTDLELELFLHACKRTGLDPLMKQIYAIKRWNAKSQKEEMAIQTGIDGYRLIADRTGRYAGSDEPVYTLDTEGNTVQQASVTVYKMVGGQRCGFSASARWNEYAQTTKEGKPTSMWSRMPYLMLAKCAEALALRKAFPAELSGIYTHEEMMQADVEQKPTVMDAKRTAQAKIQELRTADVLARSDAALDVADQAEKSSESPADILNDYLTKIDLSQSVSEVSALLNAAVKDERLDVMQVTRVQDVAKVKILALRKGK